ncbi:type II toxin-antitoxin system TacA family antitoxin [Micromonospora yangpuensis]|uniref:Uncharacterized conserved protein, DUF1778 family n=1 Tax=Micromonospora yangpuensis TaxID=683228 RepID=A0A1C6TXS7_9ACTN|nr:DUF1778 domain-containing protein [Micromonospora yangpuensis]GGM02486.1 hypothetical protein GCM10012279_20260 [Micromonospora yangpuensis]SCL46605.1 Uncharacterized conserved protein, DUF1778 family [Micromonospora yangpuensis]
MAPKTERIEMRTDPETSDLLARAARTRDESVSSFVLKAARTEADRVLARADRTIMPAEQFDEMMAALDKPDESTRLADIAARPRRFRRR